MDRETADVLDWCSSELKTTKSNVIRKGIILVKEMIENAKK